MTTKKFFCASCAAPINLYTSLALTLLHARCAPAAAVVQEVLVDTLSTGAASTTRKAGFALAAAFGVATNLAVALWGFN